MIIYKRNFDENIFICFSIKEEKVFIKYMKILKKLTLSSKVNLIVNL